MTTRTLVVLDAALEVATGVALIADPTFVVRVLLGAGLSAGGIAVGRVAGLGLLSLGLACWPSGDGASAQATWALFTYNLLVALYLGYLRVGGGFLGYLLWPAFALHALLALHLSRQETLPVGDTFASGFELAFGHLSTARPAPEEFERECPTDANAIVLAVDLLESSGG